VSVELSHADGQLDRQDETSSDCENLANAPKVYIVTEVFHCRNVLNLKSVLD
jgi:hypothetical protein